MNSTRMYQDFLTSFVQVFEPLQQLDSPDALVGFLAEFGWNIPTITKSDFDNFKIVLGVLDNQSEFSISKLNQVIDKLNNSEEKDIGLILNDLIIFIKGILQKLKNISRSTISFQIFPFNLDSFWINFPNQLINYLVYRYFQKYQSNLFNILNFIGIFSISLIPEDSLSGRSSYYDKNINWDRLPRLFQNPFGLINDVYKSKSSTDTTWIFNLIDNLRNLTDIFSMNTGIALPSPPILNKFYDLSAEYPFPIFESISYILNMYDPNDFHEVSFQIVVVPIPPKENKLGAPAGLVVAPIIKGTTDSSFSITNDLKVTLKGGFESDIGAFIKIRPGDIGLVVDPIKADDNIKAEIDFEYDPQNPIILFGSSNSSRLELQKIDLTVFADALLQQTDLGIEISFIGAKLIIQSEDGDGLLQNVLQSKAIHLDFDLTIGFSKINGFYIKGGTKLENSININKSFGPIFLSTLDISIEPNLNNKKVNFIVATSGHINFGPIVLSIARVGIISSLGFENSKIGLFGDGIDFLLDFKPPDGLGLSIDTAGVKGGGFIWRNQDQYAGVIDLDLQGFKVQALAVLDTKPDISLFFAIFASFNPPYQIGAGWKITNIGGLIGFNRTVSLQQIATGMKAGILDDILFPDKVVQNAPRLIDSYKRTFPAKLAQYLIGPAIRIGFGTPTILRGDVAILLEFPSPTQLSVIGKIQCRIPDKSPIIELNLGVIGAIDFVKGWVGIYGSLYNSKVLDFTLSGDMAMVISWGASVEKSFILSIGGFHPRFKPPSGFPPFGAPPLKRLQLALGNTLNFECYLAITSNTFQIGALVQARLSIGDVTISGSLGFDALFQFSPLYYAIDVAASFSVKYKSITLAALLFSGSLEGPNPNRIKGKITISILFLSLDVHVDITIGQKRQEVISLTDPWPILSDALSQNESWVSQSPDWAKSSISEIGVVLNEDAVKDTHIVHPTGTLKLAQKVLPLNYTLSRFGTTLPVNNFRFEISQVTAGDTSTSSPQTPSVLAFTTVKDHFAQAQFSNFSDNEKLSLRSYDTLDAGALISFEHEDKDISFFFPATIKEMKFETIIITKDKPNPDRVVVSDKSYFPKQFENKAHTEAHMTASMSSKNILNNNKLLQYNYRHTMGNKISSLSDEQYIIVNSDDLTPVQSDGLSGIFSEAVAINKLNQLSVDDRKRLKVISIYEREVTV